MVLYILTFMFLDSSLIQRFLNCEASPRGGGGASFLCEGHIYYELNMGATKICILVDTLFG
jgi:hypothetical protein